MIAVSLLILFIDSHMYLTLVKGNRFIDYVKC